MLPCTKTNYIYKHQVNKFYLTIQTINFIQFPCFKSTTHKVNYNVLSADTLVNIVNTKRDNSISLVL